MQIKAICDTCEDDGTSDRVPEVLEKLPEGIVDIYSHALKRVLRAPVEEVERRYSNGLCVHDSH